MYPSQHYTEAEKLIADGRKVVTEIKKLNVLRKQDGTDDDEYDLITQVMDERGKQAMGLWAQAQVHATLATVQL